ncbi:MAG: trigger factor [Thermoanaerobaculales bacterium]
MPHTVNRGANHTVEVNAHFDAEVVDRERKQIVRSIRNKARVPGFRPGKAPEPAVRARFAVEIRDELQEHLTNLLWDEVLKEESGLHPITHPQVSDLEFADDGRFRFTAKVEVRPSYDLPELGSLDLPEVNLEVRDAELDAELEKIQEEQAIWEPADEETAADGMLVEADLIGALEEGDDEPYTENDARFIIGSDAAPAEISAALQGAKVGEVRTAKKVLPDDLEDAERAGKTLCYTVTVKTLKRKVLPDIDDDLAAAIGLESLEQLRERISEALSGRKRSDRRTAWRRFILDHLQRDLDANDLPSSLVQAAVQDNLNHFAYAMSMQGIAPDDGRFNWQEMAAKAEPKARREVLDTLVLEQLAEAWEVTVPEADVDAYLISEAAQQGIPPAEHKANLASENKLDRIRHAARVSATVDEMIRRAGGEVE